LCVDSHCLEQTVIWLSQRLANVRKDQSVMYRVLCLETNETQQCVFNCRFSTLLHGHTVYVKLPVV